MTTPCLGKDNFYAFALGLSKAFNKMNHHGLFIKLMERDIPENLLILLDRWFSVCIT